MENEYKKNQRIKLPRVVDLRGFPELSKKSVNEELTNEDYLFWLKATRRKVEYEKIERGYIYLLKCGGFYKIGITQNLEKRLKSYYVTENPFKIEIIFQKIIDNPEEAEKELSNKFQNKRFRGEWFKLNKEDVQWIKQNI